MGLATSDKCRVVQVARVRLRGDCINSLCETTTASGLTLAGEGDLVSGSSQLIDDSSNGEKSTRYKSFID